MNHGVFDTVTRHAATAVSRRGSLRALGGVVLAGAGLALHAASRPEVARAKRKRKRQVKVNAFGCVSVGGSCRTGNQCCSGICAGKKGKRTCRAHDTGGCQAGVQDTTCAASGTDISCTASAGGPEGRCNTTTGNAGYCAVTRDCFPCRTDVECQAFCGPNAACIPCADCSETEGSSCATADGTCVPPPRPL